MSLLEEIIQLAVEEHGFARLPGNYRALNEIINKVLDAAIEAVESTHNPCQVVSTPAFLRIRNNASGAINKLRDEP